MARQKQYYWVKSIDGEHRGVLYHTEFADGFVAPFFDTEEDADRFIEHQGERYGEESYHGAVLRDTRGKKVKEAVEVFSAQSGLTDFSIDGGQTLPPGYDKELEKLAARAETLKW